MGEFFKFFLIFRAEMALSPMGFIVCTRMLVPGELHGSAIPGFSVKTFALPQRSRVGLKILALHTANQFHTPSLWPPEFQQD
jgi:hypothetical protein